MKPIIGIICIVAPVVLALWPERVERLGIVLSITMKRDKFTNLRHTVAGTNLMQDVEHNLGFMQTFMFGAKLLMLSNVSWTKMVKVK